MVFLSDFQQRTKETQQSQPKLNKSGRIKNPNLKQEVKREENLE